MRDRGLLESARFRPKNRWHYEGVTDLCVLAADLLYGIGKNHPFAQGNKRTAFHAAMAFLAVNGLEPDLPDEIFIAQTVERVIEGEEGVDALRTMFKASLNIQPEDG